MKHPIDTSAWGEFVVGELFDNIYSVRQVKSQRNIVDELKGIPFVVQTQTNNMVKCYASKNTFDEHNVPIIKGNSIAMGVDLAVISYQENDYGGSHIIVAESDKLNPLRGKFIVAIMTAKLGPKYNYVNKPGVQKYKQDVIPLPLKPSADPSNYDQTDIDWTYMETVMSRVTARAKDRLANLPQPTNKKKTPVNTSSWGDFVVGELFDNVTRGTRLKKSDRKSGPTPLVTAGSENQGIAEHILENKELFDGINLTIDMFGNVFARNYPFYADDNILVLKTNVHTFNQIQFMAGSLAHLANEYGYTNQFRQNTLNNTTIKLPLKPSADPSNYSQADIDWNYMENFMKTIEEKAHDRLKSLQKTIA